MKSLCWVSKIQSTALLNLSGGNHSPRLHTKFTTLRLSRNPDGAINSAFRGRYSISSHREFLSKISKVEERARSISGFVYRCLARLCTQFWLSFKHAASAP